MRQNILVATSVLLLACVLLYGLPLRRYQHRHMRRHFHGRRIHRQIPHYPARNEKHPSYCNIREYHVICGPEKHCDRSCDNMYRLVFGRLKSYDFFLALIIDINRFISKFDDQRMLK
uniref:Secreted protein n=1 Tax=Angiostrongylus cantonensis TaxID=6313 RepID=A0A0K0DQI7_ANGCA